MLIDSTLREGEQRYGAYFTPDQRQAILRLILATGVEEVELGIAAGAAPLAELLGLANNVKGPGQRLTLWCRAVEQDLQAAARLMAGMPAGQAAVSLCLPVSDAHLEKKLGLDRGALAQRLRACLDLTRQLGFGYVSVGLEDVSRADRAFALDMAALAQELGASRVRLSDTVGLLSPAEATALVADFRARLTIDLAVHCHNDFGLATANALAALEAGAQYADVTALGLGERAGLTALEQLAGFLTLRRGAAYDLRAIRELCLLVAAGRGVEVPAHAPLVGQRLFWADTGLHVDGLAKAPELYEPFAPQAVGLDRHLAVGAKSGAAAVEAKLRELGLADTPEQLQRMLDKVRRLSEAKGRSLDDGEIRSLAE